MDSDEVLVNVVKELILEYQENRDPAIFEQILRRVDNLVLKIVTVARYRYPHLLREESQDIYQVGLIGLHEGVLKVKKEENWGQVVARIIAYVNCAIRREFPYKPLPDMYISDHIDCVDETSIWEDFDTQLILQLIEEFVKEGLVEESEWKLLKLKYLEGCSYKLIAEHVSLSVGTVQKIVEDTILRIRHQLRLKGVTE